jgi:hypothetical protein
MGSPALLHEPGMWLRPPDLPAVVRAATSGVIGLTARWRPDVSRDAMLLVGLIVGIGQATGLVSSPLDAVAYWRAGTSAQLYPASWADTSGTFLFYPPPVAQLSTLLQPIGWTAFIVVWTTILFACFWWCARDWSLPLVGLGVMVVIGIPVPAGEAFLSYALLGNMQWLLAVLVVVSVRHPTGWAGLVWTKTGPAVGGLWHAFRGDWSAVRRAGAASIVVGLISFSCAPQMWVDWIGFVTRNAAMADPPMPLFPVPFSIRFVSACVLVAVGARSNKAWLVPIAAGWALPALWGFGFLPFWVAALRLRAPVQVTTLARTTEHRRPLSEVTLPAELVPVMDPDVVGSEAPVPLVLA